MNRLRQRLAWLFTVLVTCGLGAQAPASAQGADGWSFVVTPQIWLSHISLNGFASSGALNGLDPGSFESSSSPNDVLNPQWGIQIAAQKGRWTLAGAFQYVAFETVTDYTLGNGIFTCAVNNNVSCTPGTVIGPGDTFAKEFINTTRIDADLATSYAFPDVIQDTLDLSVGVGFKFIYASSSRQFGEMSAAAAWVNGLPPAPGLYLVCGSDDCSDFTFKDRVKQKSYLYAATFPIGAAVHLTKDSKWILPFSITPLLGVENRNDENVVYALNDNFTVDRQDGNKFAYGVTADAAIRYVINENFSAYAGMRVQFIQGHDKYLAYGPLVGMSVRFGGR